MANPGRRALFRRRGGGRGKPEYGWTACDPGTLTVSNSTQLAVLLAGSDWVRGGGLKQSCVLQRIRGQMSYQPSNVTGTCRAYIGVYDEGETVDSASLIATLFNEDILWTWSTSHTGTIDGNLNVRQIDIDIKSKRKLTNDSTIVFVYTGTAASMGFFVPMIRTLVRLS